MKSGRAETGQRPILQSHNVGRLAEATTCHLTAFAKIKSSTGILPVSLLQQAVLRFRKCPISSNFRSGLFLQIRNQFLFYNKCLLGLSNRSLLNGLANIQLLLSRAHANAERPHWQKRLHPTISILSKRPISSDSTSSGNPSFKVTT